jgi:hypothetical protein
MNLIMDHAYTIISTRNGTDVVESQNCLNRPCLKFRNILDIYKLVATNIV